ncbi:MAG: glycerophosphodiester phosphodiesterase [Spirochaetia bacterium]|nr:glycerophosphodiester phosphodiesterase [Spirochaetia bacterium]
MKIYAHRGYSGLYPENTMLAFRKAHLEDIDGIELDVQLTKDGTVVIIHDEKVDRTTNKTGLVCDYHIEELKTLNAAALYPHIIDFEPIPTFEEYCQWVKTTNLITNIEIKSGVIYYIDLEKKVVDIIKKYELEEQVIISSFNHLSLVDSKNISPNLPLAALVGHTMLKNAGYYCQKFGFSYFHPSYASLSKEIIEECHEHKVAINVWTVNTIEEISHCLTLSIDGIITNFPKEAREYLQTNT